jgi:hypothetical protein
VSELWILFGIVGIVGLLLASAWFWPRAERGSESPARMKLAVQVRELQADLIEVQDQLEQIQKILKKRGARAANSARWDGDQEPDPNKDPVAWKEWINNRGGIRRYVKGGIGGEK